jgi:hypothetical protein
MGPFFASLLGGMLGAKLAAMFNGKLNPVDTKKTVALTH